MEIIVDARAKKTLKSLSTQEQARVWGYLELFEQYGFALTAKYLKKLQNNLWELRPTQLRVLFGRLGSTIVIVHIFKKETAKTPIKELRVAQSRIKEYL